MTHVSPRALTRFIERAEAPPDFEAHVNACERCAHALSKAAAASLAPRSVVTFARLPLEAFFALAALALVVMLGPHPAPGSAPPLVMSGPVSAGVPDAGPAGGLFAPVLVASYDAGERRDDQRNEGPSEE
jgi:hypothetical protein